MEILVDGQLMKGKGETFGGPVEHVYIGRRLRNVRETHKKKKGKEKARP